MTAIDKGLNVAVFLRQVALFAGLPEADLQAIAAISELRDFSSGELVFAEGDAGDRLYVLVHGQVAVERADADGQPVTLVTLQRLDYFGEMALFDDVRRSASARVVTRTARTITLERGVFTDLLRHNVEIALHLVASQNRRLRQQNDRVVHTDREARRHAPTLAEQIEERYPHPIALVHKELDMAAEPDTKLRRLLELCEVVLLYQASLCISLYLQAGSHDPAIDADILAGQKGMTLGLCQRLVRGCLQHLADQGAATALAGRLHDWYGARGARRPVAGAFDEITLARNEIKHGSEAALDEEDCAQLLDRLSPKMEVVLESIGFLTDHPLVHIQAMSFADGVFRYSVLACRGAFRAFATESFESAVPLETGRLYVLDPAERTAVPVYPWMGLYKCETCGDRDVFLTQRWSPRALRTLEFGRGHRHSPKDVAPSVERLALALLERTRTSLPP